MDDNLLNGKRGLMIAGRGGGGGGGGGREGRDLTSIFNLCTSDLNFPQMLTYKRGLGTRLLPSFPPPLFIKVRGQ